MMMVMSKQRFTAIRTDYGVGGVPGEEPRNHYILF